MNSVTDGNGSIVCLYPKSFFFRGTDYLKVVEIARIATVRNYNMINETIDVYF